MKLLSSFVNTCIIVMTAFSIIACNGQYDVQNTSPESFQMLLKEDVILLDVRTPNEIAQGFIADASPLDYYDADFKRKLGLIQKGKPVLVYCKSGGRSSSAANLLLELGHKEVYNLSGGYMGWLKNNYPVEKSSNQTIREVQSISQEDFTKRLEDNAYVLLDFHTQWCVPCRKLEPIIQKIELEFSDEIEVIRIDVDVHKDLSERYQVSSIPTLVFISNSRELWRNSGFIDEDFLRSKIKDMTQ
ncbi:MAG: thioredoxin domain-containing protein [Flavobacteriales bacterium]|nr:thioredoxin domain-containing protein [Flavobacteriales bacterium]